MRKSILSLVLILVFSCSSSGSLMESGVHTLYSYEFLEKLEYEKELVLRNLLIESIIHIESRGDSTAFNEIEMAAGVLQIRPIMVREINRLLGFNKYSYDDRWSKVKSIEMFTDFQNIANPTWDYEVACRLWNGAYGYENKPSTIQYWNKIKKHLLCQVVHTTSN